MMMKVVKLGLIGVLAAVLAVGQSMAQTLESADPTDPPARVGRLSELDGAVSLHAGDQDRWDSAAVNYPVAAGTSVWTEPGARAALQLGPAVVRLAPETQLDVIALDDRRFQGQLGQGSVQLRIDALSPDETYEIQTARGVVRIATPGRYRIDAGDPTMPTRVTAFTGAAQVVGEGLDVVVRPGESARLTGQTEITVDRVAAVPEAIDQWAAAREQASPASGPQGPAAPRYVSPYMPGYQDLEPNGRWIETAQDGPAWIPTAVPPDWAPYRYGHWTYVAPWGWTWVDDAPWGFAPFHYGRWGRLDDRWAWYPGVVVERPVYAPALVAFVGGPPPPPRYGAAIVGVGIGALAAAAWVPLGPREPYHPPYRASARHLQGVNADPHWRGGGHRRVGDLANARAATVVPASALTGARPIGRAAVAVSPGQLAQRPLAVGPPAVRPSPASARPAAPGPLAGPGRPASAGHLVRVQSPVEHPPARPEAAGPRGVPAMSPGPSLGASPSPGAPPRWSGRGDERAGHRAPSPAGGSAAVPAAPPSRPFAEGHRGPPRSVAEPAPRPAPPHVDRPHPAAPGPQATPRHREPPPQQARPAPAMPPPRPAPPPPQIARPAAPPPAPHAVPPPRPAPPQVATHPPSSPHERKRERERDQR